MELHNTCGSLGSDVIVAEFWETIFFIVEGGILFVPPPPGLTLGDYELQPLVK